MGILDGVLGGLVSAAVVPLIQNVIEQHGGVQGLISQFEKTGLGSTIQSWIGTGENHAITAEQIHQALGSDTVKALEAKLGIPADEVAQRRRVRKTSSPGTRVS